RGTCSRGQGNRFLQWFGRGTDRARGTSTSTSTWHEHEHEHEHVARARARARDTCTSTSRTDTTGRYGRSNLLVKPSSLAYRFAGDEIEAAEIAPDTAANGLNRASSRNAIRP